MRLLTGIPFLFFASASLRAQNSGTNLTVDVTVSSVVVHADTIGITYSVYNRPASQDSLARFIVDAPATVKMIATPQPDSDYDALKTYRGRPVANWAFLGVLPPSGTSPSLYFESIGIPDIVTDWLGGHFPPTDVNDAAALPSDRLQYHSVQGKTVGVTAWPADRTPGALLTRLRGLTQSACAAPVSWITDSNLCTQLVNDIDQAQTYRSNGQINEAKASLDHFAGLLSGPGGTFAAGVSSAGYWLLVSNASIINTGL